MELWIRSQDKKHLMKPEVIMYEETGTGYGLRVFTKNYDFNIATYKSKERALEVLDEIQSILNPKMIMENNGGAFVSGDVNLHIINPTYQKIEQLDTVVYEMPKE